MLLIHQTLFYNELLDNLLIGSLSHLAHNKLIGSYHILQLYYLDYVPPAPQITILSSWYPDKLYLYHSIHELSVHTASDLNNLYLAVYNAHYSLADLKHF